MCTLEYARMAFESVRGRMRLLLEARTQVSMAENKAHSIYLPTGPLKQQPWTLLLCMQGHRGSWGSQRYSQLPCGH